MAFPDICYNMILQEVHYWELNHLIAFQKASTLLLEAAILIPGLENDY
jgi:hypothetical protein